jgi:hypothetical protein
VDSMDQPHPRFPVQDHILSVGGDALSEFGGYLVSVNIPPGK